MEAEMIGWAVISLTALISFIAAIVKPMIANTKAMTELRLTLNSYMAEQEQQRKDFYEYKKHVSEEQRRQWEAIQKQGENINNFLVSELKQKGGNKEC